MIRRYAPIKPSRGTVIPNEVKLFVFERDQGCVGFERLPVECAGGLEPDHVRASHGMGLKSVTCPCNLVSLCGNSHRYKTAYGKEARPVLLDYLATFGYGEHIEGHADLILASGGDVDRYLAMEEAMRHEAHVDRCPGCPPLGLPA